MLSALMNLGFAGQEVGIQNIANFNITMNFQTFTAGGGGTTWFKRMRHKMAGWITPNKPWSEKH